MGYHCHLVSSRNSNVCFSLIIVVTFMVIIIIMTRELARIGTPGAVSLGVNPPPLFRHYFQHYNPFPPPPLGGGEGVDNRLPSSPHV